MLTGTVTFPSGMPTFTPDPRGDSSGKFDITPIVIESGATGATGARGETEAGDTCWRRLVLERLLPSRSFYLTATAV